jgi:hypothetical protein
MHSSSKEVPSNNNSPNKLAPINGLQILSNNGLNENQEVMFMQNTCEDGKLSTIVEVFQDRMATEGKWDKDKRLGKRKTKEIAIPSE